MPTDDPLINKERDDGAVRQSVIGRIGRWCFHHRWLVLVVWAAAVVAGGLATGPLFNRLVDSGVPKSAESVAAYDVLGNDSAGTVVAVIDGVDRSKVEVRTAVTGAAQEISGLPGVRSVEQPFDESSPSAQTSSLVSTDGMAVLVSIKLTAMGSADRDATATAIQDKLRILGTRLPTGSKIEVGGSPVLSKHIRAAVKDDLQAAEFTALPLTLLVLVLVFGGLVAAGLPVLAAVVSVTTAMGVMLGFSTITDVDQDAVTVVTLLGLGLSVDYGLLLVARYREELLRDHPPEVAIARAWATAGRTVLFSALTVAASLSGLLMFNLPTLSALGAAGVSTAVVAMLVSLTFAAALIGLLQRWIRPSKHRRHRPVMAALSQTHHGSLDDRGAFAWLSRFVQRRAPLVAVVTGAALLAAGMPVLSSQIRLPGLEGLPRSIEAARVADAVSTRFVRPAIPAITVVARTDAAALDVWADQWRSDPAIAKIRPAQSIRSTPGDSLSTVAIDIVGDPQGKAVRDLILNIRDHRPALQSWVTGDAAVLTDLLGSIGDRLPVAVIVTLFAMLALLFAMTGSLVVPIKAIVASLVSLGATFGVITAVFAYGYGSGPLDTLTVGALNPFVLVVIFAFAFGLSMDYEVFLLARIKEHINAGMDTETAVRRGLRHSGRVITSAALLMVIVFGCFAAARIGNVEQIGFGLAVAVLIDATVVRCLLVPATMTLLGRWNWWAPPPLRALHERLGLREHPLPEAEPTPAREPAKPERPGRGVAATAREVPFPLVARLPSRRSTSAHPPPTPMPDAPLPLPTAVFANKVVAAPAIWGPDEPDEPRPLRSRWVRLGRFGRSW
jgi:RND superfamily putative drug exporter